MSKIAFTALLNRPDSVLSPHFGKAKWILIRDEGGQTTFEQNTVLNGRAVVDIMARHGCTDAVFTQIGDGAFVHLDRAGIRGWIGPANIPVPQLVERLERGQLERVQPPGSMSITATGAGTERGHKGRIVAQGRVHGCESSTVNARRT